MRTNKRSSASLSNHPARIPNTESSSASVSICDKSRQRLAPSDFRIANSKSRSAARASRSPETFAPVIRRTAKTAPSSVQAVSRASCT